MIGLVNVAHTGTGFVISHLFRKLSAASIARVVELGDAPQVAFEHITPLSVQSIRKLAPLLSPIIVTHRKEEDVEASWKKRNETLIDLHESRALLDAFCRDFAVLPLHIDDADVREAELAAINDKLPDPVTTRWPVVASYGDSTCFS